VEHCPFARLTAVLGALAAVCAAFASLFTNEATAEGGQAISTLAIPIRYLFPSISSATSFHLAFYLFLAFSYESGRYRLTKQSSTHDPSSVSAAAAVPAGIASADPGEVRSTSAGLEVGHRTAVGERRSRAVGRSYDHS